LKKRLFGSIQIRDVDNGVPASIKIILSAFLIFPMYRWILFPVAKKLVTVNKFRGIFKKKRPEADLEMKKREATTAEESDEEEDNEEYQDELTKKELNKELMNEMKKNRKTSNILTNYITVNKMSDLFNADEIKRLKEIKQEESREKPVYEYVSPPLYEKIYLIWSSPFTKFWMNFISYLGFLFLFSVVTMWPACGNLILDSLLWLWTASIAIEETRVTYKSYLTGSQLPLKVIILFVN
jgi:hypothetical protein